MNDLCQDYPDLDPKWLFQALILTFEDYEVKGKEPGADKWTDFGKYRRQIITDVAEEWSKASGLDDAEFGWVEDKVIRLWTKYRKKTPELRERLRRQVGLRRGFTSVARSPLELPPNKGRGR